jgi:BlaI family penicillinase repressor
MAHKDGELTEAEWQIIKAVWEHQPCAAPAVQEALSEQTGWSYSTVKTMMDRMVKKGLLKQEKIRNLILYSAAITKENARKIEILRTIKRAFDGSLTPMMQFLLENNLSRKQLAELEKMIKSQKGKKSRGE